MRAKVKQEKYGLCNICRSYGMLTWDHVPPKNAPSLKDVEMMTLIDLLSAERPDKSSRFSQNGVKFRSLCAKCNNRLGRRYDPTFINFYHAISNYLKFTSTLCLPENFSFTTKPNRLIRSVIGHILAAGFPEIKDATIPTELSNYVLNETSTLPSKFKVYYSIYPYNEQIIIQSGMLSPYLWFSFAEIMALKCFPISFFLIFDQPQQWQIPFYSIDCFLSSDIDRAIEIPISFKNIAPQRWPEYPGSSGIFASGSCTAAIKKLKSPKKF